MILYEKTAQEAVEIIKSGDRVFIHTAAAAPSHLIQAMTERHFELENVEIIAAHTEGEVPYAEDRYRDSFTINCFTRFKINCKIFLEKTLKTMTF